MIQAEIERCAGIDVGKKWLAVCILVGPLDAEPRSEIRKFGTNVVDLEQLRDWLQENGITHAVMESTGSYWKPVFNILEEALTGYLANPHQVKPRKGHKTDNKDGYWLAHLLRHAMIQPSFIPSRPIRELRDLTRGCRPIAQPPFWRKPARTCSNLGMSGTSVRGLECIRATTGARARARAATRTKATPGCGAP